MNTIMHKLIMLYILSRTKIITMYYYVRSNYITNVDTITGIKKIKNGTKTNLMYKYLLVKSINYLINILQMIKRTLDTKCTLIEVNNNYCDRIETRLYASKEPQSYITIDNIYPPNLSLANNLVSRKYETKSCNRIFTQFALTYYATDPDNSDKIPINKCLKQYLIKYRDDSGLYDNTIENILTMNKIIMYTTDTYFITCTYLDRGRKKHIVLPYDEVKDKHINYFYNLTS